MSIDLARGAIVCIAGATASGKTALALHLARNIKADLISVDSGQVYRGMDVGSAKPDDTVLAEFPHQLLNVRDIDSPYSAADFAKDARALVVRSLEAGRTPILVGGTMFYFHALLKGLPKLPPADPGLRAELESTTKRRGLGYLHNQLMALDTVAGERINPNDSQRIIRAIEINMLTGRCVSEQEATIGLIHEGVAALKLAVNIPDRGRLHQRLEERLNAMLDQGFVEEVRSLRRRYPQAGGTAAMRSVGYQQIWTHLEDQTSETQMRADILTANRRLAKRQLTWIRNESGFVWVDATHEGFEKMVFNYVSDWIGAKR